MKPQMHAENADENTHHQRLATANSRLTLDKKNTHQLPNNGPYEPNEPYELNKPRTHHQGICHGKLTVSSLLKDTHHQGNETADTRRVKKVKWLSS